VLALVARLSGRFGRTRLAALAVAADDDPRLIELPERGMLRGRKQAYVLDLLRTLDGAGLVETSHGEYPTTAITPRGRRIAAGKEGVDDLGLAMPEARAARVKSKSRRAASAVPAPAADTAPGDPELVERLRAVRTRLAGEQEVPAYVIFPDRTLHALARARPRSRHELAAVPGIGPSRLAAFGDAILAAIT
jgi:ATP-dependent DNA helicase RecQ